MDTAIDRSIFPAGVHCVTLRGSDLQGRVHLVREHATEAIRHKEAHPSEINKEVIRRTISYVRRALDPNPNVLLHGAWLAGEAKSKQIENTPLQQEKTTPLPGAGRGTADV